MNLKHIPLKGAYNVRDLGGYPTTDDRYTRWGLLYRSDSLADLTEADWHALSRRNIKTVVDLRSNVEVSSSKINMPESIQGYHFPLMSELDGFSLNSNQQNLSMEIIAESMKLDYGKTLFGNIRCSADILKTISERMAIGGVVFFCSAGKDRTGIVAALILYLCDVIREDVIADYMVSSTYNTNGVNKKTMSIPAHFMKMIPDPKMLEGVLASKPETIIRLLEEMDAKNIKAALAENGFTIESQLYLKEQFTEQIEKS